MEDLDTFFAKRDKKRPKGKKFATADDAAKVLESNARERKKNEMKSNYVMPLTESGEVQPPINEYRQQPDEDDEWKETVEIQPDFSNLKIQELIPDDDDEFEGKETEGRIDIDNDTVGGPWNKQKGKDEKSDIATLPEEKSVVAEVGGSKDKISEEDEEKGEEKSADANSEAVAAAGETTAKTGGYVPPNRRKEAAKPLSEPVKTSSSSSSATAPSSSSDAPKGAYVPPSRRGLTSSSTSSGSGSGATRSKKPVHAPNIDNNEAFPTLGS